MRKILVLIGALMLAFTGMAYALDAPHNETNSISCYDCHLGGQASVDPNTVCLGCHVNDTGGNYGKTSAPLVATHSSAVVGNKYGTWTKQCTDCHYFHFFSQHYVWGAASYIATGTITSFTDNGDGTSTFGYSGLSVNRSNWSDPATWGQKTGAERGLILLPNTKDVSFGFEIISADASSIIVKGSTAPFSNKLHVGDSFAIIYGQGINTYIPDFTKQVKFFDHEGENSFAKNDFLGGDIDGDGNLDDSTPDGVCQVCHTLTAHWRSDGTKAEVGVHTGLGGTNCTSCHPHSQGFKPAGACDSCHGYPPTEDVLNSASSNGKSGLVDNPDPTGSTTAGAHQKHATSAGLNLSCDTCHSGYQMPESPSQIIDIGFNIFGYGGTNTKYDGQTTVDGYRGRNGTSVTQTGTLTCSNIYCHSIVQSNGGGTLTPDTADYASPVWNNPASVQCGSCHKADGVQGNATLMDSGSHTEHVNTSTYGFVCSKCHNGAGYGTSIHVNNEINVIFDASLGGSYGGDSGNTGNHAPGQGYGSCTSVYCHSDGNGGAPNTTPTWGGTLPADCTGCHDNNATASPNTMSTGGHTAHVNKGNIMTNKTCDTCHTSTVSGDRTIVDYTLHVNGTKNITINATYDGDTTPENNYSSGQCSNLYCHSDATSLTGPYNAPNTVPTWGTTTNLGCSDCHTGPPTGPDYTNGSPKANSHNKHVVVNGYTCDTCHQATTSDGTTITDPTKHLNKQYDVSGTAIGGYAYNASGGTCTNISCHGGNSAQWGSTVSCADCHLGTGDVDDYVYNNGTTARLDTTEWTSSGHGRTTGTYAASGKSAANLSCEYCHDGTVGHGTATNPFRLANYNTGGNGWNDVCFVCHKTGSAGYDPDGGGPLALRNSSLKIDKYHYGAKHGTSNDGGSLCFDCHDPHGDSNIYMVHDNVTKDKADSYGTPASTAAPVFTANTTGTDYAKSSSPFNGVCNVCHTSTNHYTSSSGDGHNSGTRCTNCHNHSGDTVVNGDAFKPSGNCDSCHGYPPTPGDGYVYQDDPVQEGKGAHAQHVSHIAALKGVTLDPANDSFGTGAPGIVCGTCHTNDSANHMSGTRVINFGDGSTEYQFGPNAPVYNGVPGTSSTVNPKTCSNVSCHFKDSPAWQDPSAPK